MTAAAAAAAIIIATRKQRRSVPERAEIWRKGGEERPENRLQNSRGSIGGHSQRCAAIAITRARLSIYLSICLSVCLSETQKHTNTQASQSASQLDHAGEEQKCICIYIPSFDVIVPHSRSGLGGGFRLRRSWIVFSLRSISISISISMMSRLVYCARVCASSSSSSSSSSSFPPPPPSPPASHPRLPLSVRESALAQSRGAVVALGKFDALHMGHAALGAAAVEVARGIIQRETAASSSRSSTSEAVAEDDSSSISPRVSLLSFSGMAEALGWAPRPPLTAPADRARVMLQWEVSESIDGVGVGIIIIVITITIMILAP